jgi:uncharacterized protein YbjT (DUF2867 family)
MILVTAANGNQGRLLVPKLLAAEQPVRACVQSQASAQQLRALGVQDVVVGDITEPAVLGTAIRGVEKVYHVGPTAHPRERAMGLAVVDAARAEGVKHLVFSSVLHAITTDLVQHEIKRDIEEHLLSSGLEFTILQPATRTYSRGCSGARRRPSRPTCATSRTSSCGREARQAQSGPAGSEF